VWLRATRPLGFRLGSTGMCTRRSLPHRRSALFQNRLTPPADASRSQTPHRLMISSKHRNGPGEQNVVALARSPQVRRRLRQFQRRRPRRPHRRTPHQHERRDPEQQPSCRNFHAEEKDYQKQPWEPPGVNTASVGSGQLAWNQPRGTADSCRNHEALSFKRRVFHRGGRNLSLLSSRAPANG
jgi:hypothetical protein